MYERLEALEAKVRLIEAWLRGHGSEKEGERFGDPAPVPVAAMDDPEKAKAAYEAAQAEVKNQEERGKANLAAAQENAKRAKEVLDKSVAETKSAPQDPPPQPTPPRAAASSRGD